MRVKTEVREKVGCNADRNGLKRGPGKTDATQHDEHGQNQE